MSKEEQLMKAIRYISKAAEEDNIEKAISLLEGAEMYITEQKEFLKKDLGGQIENGEGKYVPKYIDDQPSENLRNMKESDLDG